MYQAHFLHQEILCKVTLHTEFIQSNVNEPDNTIIHGNVAISLLHFTLNVELLLRKGINIRRGIELVT